MIMFSEQLEMEIWDQERGQGQRPGSRGHRSEFHTNLTSPPGCLRFFISLLKPPPHPEPSVTDDYTTTHPEPCPDQPGHLRLAQHPHPTNLRVLFCHHHIAISSKSPTDTPPRWSSDSRNQVTSNLSMAASYLVSYKTPTASLPEPLFAH